MSWARKHDDIALQMSPSPEDDPWGLKTAPDRALATPASVVRLPVGAARMSVRHASSAPLAPNQDRPALTLDLAAPAAPETSKATWLVAAVTVAAIAAGIATGVVAWISVRGARTAAVAETGLVIVSSHPAGAAVSIDGKAFGVTPAAVPVSVGRHRIAVDGGNGQPAQTFDADIARGGEWRQHLELAPAPAATAALNPNDPTAALATSQADAHVTASLKPGPLASLSPPPTATTTTTTTTAAAPIAAPRGWVLVEAPFDVQVIEGGRTLGPGRQRLSLGAGRHELELANPALGYSSLRTVTVVADRGTSIPIEVPTSTLDVNALPWAEVTIDGRPYGETPLANVALPIGEHSVVLRHPSLGERTTVAVVGLRAPNRLSIDLRR